jgi:uncharacterized protein (TIGR02284 family)
MHGTFQPRSWRQPQRHELSDEGIAMSADARVTKDLMEVLADGEDGFNKAADKLADTNSPELAGTFRRYAEQRRSFYAELEMMAAEYGDDIDEDGSVVASIHRGWMSIKDALAGSSASGVVDAAEQGEDHAVEVYSDALEAEISPRLRSVVQRQAMAIRAAHDEVRSLKRQFHNT